MQQSPYTPARTSSPNDEGGAIVVARPNNNDPYKFASGGNKENNALVRHSPHTPILSSILPKSTIKQFETDVLRRQAEYTTRITDLEGRLSMFHTRLAIECAERGREHAFTVAVSIAHFKVRIRCMILLSTEFFIIRIKIQEYVDEPLEQATRRSLELIDTEYVRPIMDPMRATDLRENGYRAKHESDVDGATREESADSNHATNTTTAPHALPNLVSIERRTNLLEAQMNHHRHVTLFHSRRENFDAINKECIQTLQPALALEVAKADKREGGMVRRFDSNAGEYTRVVTDMTSSRVSSLGYIERRLENWDISDSNRAENYLEEIRMLKQRVTDMRRERIRQDELVVEKIMQTKKVLEEDIFLAC
jgi:hypothetical protein